MSIALTGIANDDPRPRTAREFLYAQGDSTGASGGRAIVLVGNKTSAGSETVETIGTPILSLADCYARFGRRSEIAWKYRVAIMVAPAATYYAVAVAENGSATASAITWTFATTADNPSTIRVEWGTKRLEIPVASGDTATTQGANVAAKVQADPDLPFSASASSGAVTFTASNLGPRGDLIINRLRVYYTTAIATTVSKGSLTAGSGADDVTNATNALLKKQIYYHSIAATASTTVTSADGGVGQYIAFIRNQSSPTVGFDQLVSIGLDCAQSTATTVATSAAANAVRATFWHVHNNDWSPPMIAAHCTAVKWVKETPYPAASLRGYTQTDTFNFAIPPPFAATDRLSSTEISADLNNGVTPIDFTPNGAAVIPRQITSYNLVPGTSNKDYRAREGHIPSTEDAAWEYLEARWLAVRQDNVTSDPPKGAPPLKGFNTPGSVRALIFSAIDVLSSSKCPFDNRPILDPGAVDDMKASVYVEARAAGIGVSVDWRPVRHDLFDDFQIKQGGDAY